MRKRNNDALYKTKVSAPIPTNHRISKFVPCPSIEASPSLFPATDILLEVTSDCRGHSP